MGARCVIRFTESSDPASEPVARVYLHHGGEHFDDVAQTMRDFLREVAVLADPRWGDPSYLAAKLVVWAAMQSRTFVKHGEGYGPDSYRPSENPLEFLSVGVVDCDDWGDYVGTICKDGSGVVAYAGSSASEQREAARVGVLA